MITDDRELPHNIEAEKATIGGVLVSPEWLPSVAWLEPESYYRTAHGRLWREIVAMDRDGVALDLVTLRARLAASGALEAVGGVAYITSLVDGVPHSSNVEHYAAIVQQQADARATIRACSLKIDACYEDAADAEALTTEADTILARLERGTRADGLMNADAQIRALLTDLERDAAGPKVDLGLPSIDNVLDGVRPGEVLQIWARPGLGKTMVACHALCGLVAKMPVVCFSLEMPAAQIVRRLARMQFGLTNHRLRRGELDASAYTEWFSAFRLDASPGLSVAQMGQRVRRLQREGGVRAVVVDHLGLVGGDRAMSTYDRVSTQAREFKELAKRYEVAVILLVQVNREAGGDGSRELHLGSARDSGVIEEVADYIVALRRLDRSVTLPQFKRDLYRDVIFAKVLKHRHGSAADPESAYRLNPDTLRLAEDTSIRLEEDDLAAIAERAGRRR